MRKSLRVQAFSFVHRVGIVLIYLFAKAAEMSANLWREVRRIRGGGKRVDTYGFYPLNSRFPLFVRLAQTRDRRPLRKEERQSSYYGVSFSAYSQFTDSVLLHISATLRWVRHDSAAQFAYALLRTAPANFI